MLRLSHRLAPAILLLSGLAACSGMAPPDFAAGRPLFRPDLYFDGHVVTEGIMEDRSGEPIGRFTVDNVGHRDGDALVLVQHIVMDAKPSDRTWRLRRLDEHRYEATGTDIVGTARGEAYGNVLKLEWVLATEPGNSLKDVSMKQWMYLQPDGRSMVNRTTISKLGVILVELTEWFHKES